ncbi:MAG: hypothetical protein DHS20C02_16000 [Micavibrio sp.]|nr:MAG: hypothetical protein DHS20C02_16000 [Micavibrio sp.]
MNHLNFKTFFSFLGLAVLGSLFIASHSGSALAGQELTDGQKQEVEQVIKDYLLENPEVIMKSVELYQVNKEKDKDKNAAAKVDEHNAYLTSSDAPSAGNPDGDVIIVEFFDYNCGYCKKALSDIQKVMDADKNVRFVFREMPILGPTSLTAAQWALAAHKQGKYFEYHAALMEHRGSKSESELSKLAEGLGLDADKMKTDANSAEVKTMLKKSIDVAREIGIQGTPAFILNGQLVRGYMGPDGLKRAIDDARKKEG